MPKTMPMTRATRVCLHQPLLPLWLISVFSFGTLGACGDDVVTPSLPPTPLAVEGSYDLVSSFDLTTAALLPQSAYDYLTDLQALRDDPAAAFFRVLDQAGVPLAGDLLGILPGPLADRLKGWINDYVFHATFQGRSVPSELDLLLQQASIVLTRFQITSDLGLPALDSGGRGDATHTLRRLRFSLWSGTVSVAVPIDLAGLLLPDEVFVTQARASALVSPGLAGADAHLTLNDHVFGMPFGRLAWTALDEGSRQRNGGNVRAALGTLFDCPALASSVAQRCVLGVCVGHAAEVREICDRALDQVVSNLRARFESLNFNAVRLQQGDAAMWDASAATPAEGLDRRVDRLDRGVWNASIDIGMGPRAVPSSFTRSRR